MQCETWMRVAGAVAVAAGLSACSPRVPDSGVAASDDWQYADAVDASATRPQAVQAPVPPASAVETAQLDPAPGSDDIARETAAALTGPAEAPVVVAAVESPVSGLSKENDFQAVSAQRSIEGDAARLAQQKAEYVVITPTAVPERPGGGVNIVTYALQTSNPVGVQQYGRFGIAKASRAERNCARYPSDDRAQTAFLEAGGPERDPKGLDPDGDGYACGWNPSKFRVAVAG